MVAALQAHELLEGCPADDPVDGQARVALELGQGVPGGVPEDAVDPARIEAEGAQALLQFRHVVTPQHGSPAVQEAVTHPKTGLDQGVPGLRAAHAVDVEAAQALESLERGPGAGPEDAVGVDRRAGHDRGQPVLDVGHRVAAVADGEGQAGGRGCLQVGRDLLEELALGLGPDQAYLRAPRP